MKRSNVLLMGFFILGSFLSGQDIDVMDGIQRLDTTRALAPLDLDEIPDKIENTSGQESAEDDAWQKALIDSLEYRFNLEKERMAANFKTSYRYKLNQAVDSIRLSIAEQIKALEEEIEALRQQERDRAGQVSPDYQSEKDSLLTVIRHLRESLSTVKDQTDDPFIPEEIKREQAFYQYLLQLMEEKSSGSLFFLKNTELPELQKRELSLYLDMYLPVLNSSEVLIRLSRVYEDQKEPRLAKLTYLKYLFYFPESANLTYIKEQIKLLMETYPDPRDTLLSAYLKDETRESMEGSTLFKYIRAIADIGYPGCEPLFEKEILRFQKESQVGDRVDRALIWYADILKNQKRYKSAVSQLQKVVTVYPESPEVPVAIYNMAEIYRNYLKESGTAFEKFRGISIKYPESKLAPRAILMSGEIQEKDLKDPVAALTEYEKIPTAYPGNRYAVTALKNMGRIYQTLSKSSELAFKQYEIIKNEYASFYSDAAEAMITIAGLHVAGGEYRKAVEEIRELYERYPEYDKTPDQLIKAGRFLEKELADREGAIEIYTILITQYPETKASEKARKALAKLQKE
ncbi:MAG: tetratricopeptide repeat protein [Candidatus Marinimicrobia bacterium]|nr:tetratricopeptide repeat protein [Candidatus Neomarinimicrobiota bacterium]